MTIPEQVDAYRALLDEKDRLAEETKANNRAIEAARDALATAMIEDETPQITRNGYSYTLTPKTKYSKAAGKDAELMDALRSNGLGDRTEPAGCHEQPGRGKRRRASRGIRGLRERVQLQRHHPAQEQPETVREDKHHGKRKRFDRGSELRSGTHQQRGH